MRGYFIAVGIPLVLIFSGALARKLVRGTAWKQSDFYLGIELALAAMASALVFIFELSQTSDPKAIQNKVLVGALFTIVCFFLLFWVMAVHQDWEKRPQNRYGQLIWLSGICNLIGVGLLAGFVIFVKGVN